MPDQVCSAWMLTREDGTTRLVLDGAGRSPTDVMARENACGTVPCVAATGIRFGLFAIDVAGRPRLDERPVPASVVEGCSTILAEEIPDVFEVFASGTSDDVAGWRARIPDGRSWILVLDHRVAPADVAAFLAALVGSVPFLASIRQGGYDALPEVPFATARSFGDTWFDGDEVPPPRM